MNIEVGDKVRLGDVNTLEKNMVISSRLQEKLGKDDVKVTEVNENTIKIVGVDDEVPKSWVREITWKHLTNEEIERAKKIFIEDLNSYDRYFGSQAEKSNRFARWSTLRCPVILSVITTIIMIYWILHTTTDTIPVGLLICTAIFIVLIAELIFLIIGAIMHGIFQCVTYNDANKKFIMYMKDVCCSENFTKKEYLRLKNKTLEYAIGQTMCMLLAPEIEDSLKD